VELRCDSKLHGIVVDTGVVEVKCDSRFCGAQPGVTVLHRFDVVTGELVGTVKFKSPERRKA
jgi:hypothetical protein